MHNETNMMAKVLALNYLLLRLKVWKPKNRSDMSVPDDALSFLVMTILSSLHSHGLTVNFTKRQILWHNTVFLMVKVRSWIMWHSPWETGKDIISTVCHNTKEQPHRVVRVTGFSAAFITAGGCHCWNCLKTQNQDPRIEDVLFRLENNPETRNKQNCGYDVTIYKTSKNRNIRCPQQYKICTEIYGTLMLKNI